MTQDHRAVSRPDEPAGAAPQANRMRRATDQRPSTSPQNRRKSSRSVLALLDAAGMSGEDRPGASLWSGRNTLIATLTPLFEQAAQRGTAVALLLIRIAQPLALRAAADPSATEAFHLAAAARLRPLIRASDVLLRLTDSSLALVLQGCGEPDAARAVARVGQALSRDEIATELGPVTADVKFGVAVAADGSRDAHRLLGEAEAALGDAPRDSTGSSQAIRALATDIIAALDASRLVLATQPIVSARSREIFCFEALARLSRADGTALSPADIMPVAELTGLIVRLDTRMLQLAAAHLHAHPADQLSLNVSMRSMLDPDWIDTADGLLADARSLAARLIVEITETVAIDDLQATIAVIRRLKAFGVRIAMDDFGAGHSSFRNLRHLGIDILKIDGGFVRDLPHSADDGAFVRPLVSLARHLGIATVAEWVEDETTASLLTEWGVDYLQGHLTGKAIVA